MIQRNRLVGAHPLASPQPNDWAARLAQKRAAVILDRMKQQVAAVLDQKVGAVALAEAWALVPTDC